MPAIHEDSDVEKGSAIGGRNLIGQDDGADWGSDLARRRFLQQRVMRMHDGRRGEPLPRSARAQQVA